MNLAFQSFPKVSSRMMMKRAASTGADINYKVAFMFPGQGAQFVGMGKNLCEGFAPAKELFSKASAILGYDLLEKCTNGPKSELDTTVISQPAIFVSSMAALEKLKAENPSAIESASVAMGLSLGEYSALCFAGAFSFEDGVRLTKIRGEAMQAASDASSSGMVAVIGLDASKVAELCKEASEKTGKHVTIANYLGKGNYVASGAKEACAAVQELGPKYGSKLIRQLDVAGAFHTKFMEPAVITLQKALAEVKIQTPRIPVISNVDAKPHYDANEIRDILTRQVTNPVQWETIISTMLQSPSYTKGYEIGPGNVLKNLVKKVGKQFEVDSIGVE